MDAEAAYLFRHALLRDAAYELQLPRDRARMHGLALELIEAAFGAPPPEQAPDAWDETTCPAHPIDALAGELAQHAGLARTFADSPDAGLLRKEILYLRRAATYAQRSFHGLESERLWGALAELVVGTVRAKALRMAAMQAYGSGRVVQSETLFSEALRIAREAGDKRSESATLGKLALLYRDTGRNDLAEETTDRALVLLREVGNRDVEGETLANLAGLCHATGRFKRAEQLYDDAVVIFRETGHRTNEGVTLAQLAGLYQSTGRVELAEQVHYQAQAILREVGDRRTEGVSLGNLASVYVETGRAELGERTFERALAIQREIGNRRSEGVVLGNLADLYYRTGRNDQARHLFEQAIEIHRDVGNRRFEGAHLCAYSLCLLAQRRSCEARDHWRQGHSLLLQVRDQPEAAAHAAVMRIACEQAGVPPFDLVPLDEVQDRREKEGA